MPKHSVFMWKEEGLWTAHTPSLPGVYGIGTTKQGALNDYADAAALMLGYIEEIGERPPRPLPLDVVEVEF